MVNKMNGESVDLTAQNIARLKELFPEISTDGGKIDFDMLKTILGEVIETEPERYQFTWHGKKKMIEGTQKPTKGTLRPVPEKSKNFDTTENLYIEGDNLEVLKLLQKSYNGKIKMIYIDPPYNTGKDFVYKDNFKDGVQNYLEQTGQVDAKGNVLSTNSESNGRFHTDWLNMMYARLKLARNLLTDDGAIFISIDNNEYVNLKKLCDEVFGENNFVSSVAVVNNFKGRSDDEYIATAHEHLLIYRKTDKFKTLGVPIPEEYIKEYKEQDEKGQYRLLGLRKRGSNSSRADRPNMYYPFYYNSKIDKISLIQENEEFVEIFPKLSDGTDGCWRWGKENSKQNLDQLVAKYISTRNEYDIYQKDYLIRNGEIRKVKPKSVWLGSEFSNDSGTIAYRELMVNKYFNNPKSVDLIKYCLHQVLDNNDIVLDFFSGSGTTGQALMDFNAETNKSNKFILVQLPEKIDEGSTAYKDGYKIICDIGEERIRRAGEKIKTELKEKQQKAGMLDENVLDPEALDIGFKVLKLDTSNIREWNVEFENLKDELDLYETPFIDGRSELDIVYEIILKQGLELTYPIETFEVNDKMIYDIAFGSLFICLSQGITTDIAKAIIVRRDEHGTETSSVIFSDAGFEHDSDKLNCIEILKDAGYPEDNLLTL